MGGAQPLAATMNEGVIIAVEVDRSRIQRRLETRYLDVSAESLDEALARAREGDGRGPAALDRAARQRRRRAARLVRRGVVPDLVTDQTSAHDPLSGYVPNGMTYEAALGCARTIPGATCARPTAPWANTCARCSTCKRRGAVTFDYGNNIRAQAQKAGVEDAFDFPGFVPAYIRPLFCEGKGPFRWAVLSGDPADLAVTDEAVLRTFPEDRALARWITLARERVAFQGLPARICWLGYGERAKMGLVFNELVRTGKVERPIVIGRDHLDAGSVASPNRETEAMRDGSDAVADWPILNALLNAVAGATWVSVHHGGGVGMGYSIHAGMVVVADGTDSAAAPPPTRADDRSRHRRHAPRGRRATRARSRWRASAACARPSSSPK